MGGLDGGGVGGLGLWDLGGSLGGIVQSAADLLGLDVTGTGGASYETTTTGISGTAYGVGAARLELFDDLKIPVGVGGAVLTGSANENRAVVAGAGVAITPVGWGAGGGILYWTPDGRLTIYSYARQGFEDMDLIARFVAKYERENWNAELNATYEDNQLEVSGAYEFGKKQRKLVVKSTFANDVFQVSAGLAQQFPLGQNVTGQAGVSIGYDTFLDEFIGRGSLSIGRYPEGNNTPVYRTEFGAEFSESEKFKFLLGGTLIF